MSRSKSPKQSIKEKMDASLVGAFVADAAGVGFEWLYDQARIVKITGGKDACFHTPDSTDYRGVTGYYVMDGKKPGDISMYGVHLQAALEAVATNANHQLDGSEFLESFTKTFGYGGTYHGYIDKTTRLTLNNILLREAGHLDVEYEECGADDPQASAFAKLPALLKSSMGTAKGMQFASEVVASIKLTNNNDLAIGTGIVMAGMLRTARSGDTLANTIIAGANVAENIGGKVQELFEDATADNSRALSQQDYATKKGLSCALTSSFPVIIHAICKAKNSSFKEVINNNVLCGGDCCGRSIMIGAILGPIFGLEGIPKEWQKMVKKQNPDLWVTIAALK